MSSLSSATEWKVYVRDHGWERLSKDPEARRRSAEQYVQVYEWVSWGPDPISRDDFLLHKGADEPESCSWPRDEES
ncbi:hypothetical protein N7532_010859 [Penicillium argentinense]|uniref:Uncharacterized protein n=1 Tax=Penicillium argentinense TaxID=1131581 RepID=A0A9W9EQD5_9EURO|nr:uncharacterized protein N7532_010859 [Penicillium argentinense]KAJ5086088.1 hypothetical protein N7532_010859 [Penicillium argentinense]